LSFPPPIPPLPRTGHMWLPFCHPALSHLFRSLRRKRQVHKPCPASADLTPWVDNRGPAPFSVYHPFDSLAMSPRFQLRNQTPSPSLLFYSVASMKGVSINLALGVPHGHRFAFAPVTPFLLIPPSTPLTKTLWTSFFVLFHVFLFFTRIVKSVPPVNRCPPGAASPSLFPLNIAPFNDKLQTRGFLSLNLSVLPLFSPGLFSRLVPTLSFSY